MMTIRKTTLSDLPLVMEIYAHARSVMAKSGNRTQWGDVWPPESLIRKDIEEGKSYVCEKDGTIAAVFFYDYGKDIESSYAVIHNGTWMSEAPYGVVHRIATAEEGTGIGAACINWAYEKSGGHLRIDTHENNTVMRHVLESLGFSYCGMIDIVEDTDPRMAFEKIKDSLGGK